MGTLDKPQLLTIIWCVFILSLCYTFSITSKFLLVPIFIYIIFFLTSFFFRIGAQCLFKVHWFVLGSMHTIFSKDKNIPKSHKGRADKLIKNRDSIKSLQKKTIIFIRHGESTWNEVFNREFGVGIIFRILWGLIQEIFYFPTRNSFYIDAPLSHEGESQVDLLKEWLNEPDKDDDSAHVKNVKDIFLGRSENYYKDTVLFASNLRRSIETASLTFKDRLLNEKNREKLFICSYLQEAARNIDTVSLSDKGKVPHLSILNKQLWEMYKEKDDFIDPKLNFGNKLVLGNVVDRMNFFCELLFFGEHADKKVFVLAGGHSHWVRHFFQNYLPVESKFIGKTQKVQNCGVVKFDVLRGEIDGEVYFSIDPDNIETIYLGYENNKTSW